MSVINIFQAIALLIFVISLIVFILKNIFWAGKEGGFLGIVSAIIGIIIGIFGFFCLSISVISAIAFVLSKYKNIHIDSVIIIPAFIVMALMFVLIMIHHVKIEKWDKIKILKNSLLGLLSILIIILNILSLKYNFFRDIWFSITNIFGNIIIIFYVYFYKYRKNR